MQHIISNIPITRAATPSSLYMRPATLYYLRLEFPPFPSTIGTSNGGMCGNNATSCGNTPLVLYKLGYTTTSLHERVYGKPIIYTRRWVGNKRKVLRNNGHNGMGLPAGTDVYIISTLQHRNGALVFAWEQYLHNKHQLRRYNGPPVMGNGNTELYTVDILELDC